VARDLGFWARWRWGWHIFVEEAVAGEPLGPGTSILAVEAMGRAYAAVHAVRGEGWGRVDAPQVGGFVADRRRRLAGLAEEVRAVAPAALRSGIERLLGELDMEPLEEPEALSLCHNRVTADNVILTAEGGCTLIDLERVKLGSHLQEVAKLEFEVFAGDAARFQTFLASYTAAAPVALQPASDARTWLWYRLVAGLKKLRDLSAVGREAEAEGWLRRLPPL
jgi:Ser/Thr protein kinase RdoA (MazF antagonist)